MTTLLPINQNNEGMPTHEEYTRWKEKVVERLHREDVEKTPLTKRELLLLLIAWNQSDEIDQEIYEENMRKAIDEAGGCSQCGDLDGYSCTCDDEDELEEDACGYCRRTDFNWLLNGLCETCHDELMREHIDNPYT